MCIDNCFTIDRVLTHETELNALYLLIEHDTRQPSQSASKLKALYMAIKPDKDLTV